MPEANWATHLAREIDDERTAQTLATVISLLLAEALEFDGALLARANAEYSVSIHKW